MEEEKEEEEIGKTFTFHSRRPCLTSLQVRNVLSLSLHLLPACYHLLLLGVRGVSWPSGGPAIRPSAGAPAGDSPDWVCVCVCAVSVTIFLSICLVSTVSLTSDTVTQPPRFSSPGNTGAGAAGASQEHPPPRLTPSIYSSGESLSAASTSELIRSRLANGFMFVSAFPTMLQGSKTKVFLLLDQFYDSDQRTGSPWTIGGLLVATEVFCPFSSKVRQRVARLLVLPYIDRVKREKQQGQWISQKMPLGILLSRCVGCTSFAGSSFALRELDFLCCWYDACVTHKTYSHLWNKLERVKDGEIGRKESKRGCKGRQR